MISSPNIDPVAIDLGFISIYWYGISYVVGILTAWFLLKYRVRQSQLLLDNQQIGDLVFFVMLLIMLLIEINGTSPNKTKKFLFTRNFFAVSIASAVPL